MLTAEEFKVHKKEWQRRYRVKNKEKIHLYEVCKHYNLTPAQYEELRQQFNSRCALCGAEESTLKERLHVDHDHKCCAGETSCGKCIRGLLCRRCNQALGLFRDNPDILKKAVVYVL